MTVIGTSYSFLEEVWGEHQPKVKKERKNKSKSRRVIPEDDGVDSKYDDIMDTYGSHYGHYDKSEFSRTLHPLPYTEASDREEDLEGYTDKDDILEKDKEKLAKLIEMFDSKHVVDKEKRYLDFGLYMFSGVALIFMMEQFLKIGITLGARSANR